MALRSFYSSDPLLPLYSLKGYKSTALKLNRLPAKARKSWQAFKAMPTGNFWRELPAMGKPKNGGKPRSKFKPDISVEAQGRRIGLLRFVKGWSNAEMALRVGLSQQQLSHFIHGNKKVIDPKHLFRIAMACEVTTDWIIYGDRRHLSPTILKALPPEGEE